MSKTKQKKNVFPSGLQPPHICVISRDELLFQLILFFFQ
jgi:hypothetical protein